MFNAVIMVAALVFWVRGFPSAGQLQQSIAKDYPAEVLPYLQSHPPSGPVLNEYSWGGYLCWNDRGFKEFIDSRADVFVHAGVFSDYIDVLDAKDAGPVLDKYGIRYVLFPRKEILTYVLRRDPNWKVLFSGDLSMMLERVGPMPAKGPNGRVKGGGAGGR
jgi:hypothetical protein